MPDGLCACGCGEKTRIAPQTRTNRGWVKGQPLRFVGGHVRIFGAGPDYVVDSNGCWIWQRHTISGGYGHRKVGDRMILAHRFEYEKAHGVLPDGVHVHHRCGVRHCVNPEHLEPITPQEHRREHAPKLTLDSANAIRRRRVAGERNRDLADEYGVSRSMISEITSGRAWR